MADILFVGSRTKGYFAEEVAKEKGLGYMQIEASHSIRSTTNEILTLRFERSMTFDFIIYDVDMFIDDAEEVASEIRGVADTFHAMPIAFMPSFIAQSVMAQALLSRGIRNFISSGDAAGLKEQLVRNMGGYYDVNERKETAETEALMETAKLELKKSHSIGVAGSQSRVGTSTQALQIVQYLKFKGYKACYIEQNHVQYLDTSGSSGALQNATLVEKYRIWNDVPKNSFEKLTYKGVDMYAGQEAFAKLQSEKYDFYVYDYGNILDRDFDRTAFLKDDIRIITAGAKATEFDYLMRFLSVPSYSDAGIVLSFVPETEQSEVLKPIVHMKNWSEKDGRVLVFAPYTPDPFLLSSAEIYEKLIPIEATEEAKAAMVEKQPKKKGIFRRKEKN
ncbi:hypothetical protein [Emergencia sp. 1XD21-10]|uniref:hypothetical protein n=1 Tax=Emergencia sp. 1XD21-10 TaxID=2304569 RepID=UPI00137B726A|nr:hypothetical protein [Emergencia sp. 1XD21-10]NCE98109.1 hypothetical protein [Emergencia sp. 1XD21-10]